MCNCCSETKKKDRSEFGIPACEGKNEFVSLLRVIDDEFNRRYYARLIGRTFTSKNAPSYAHLEEVEEKSGQIFDVRDLRSMEVAANQIGRASERKLFA